MSERLSTPFNTVTGRRERENGKRRVSASRPNSEEARVDW